MKEPIDSKPAAVPVADGAQASLSEARMPSRDRELNRLGETARKEAGLIEKQPNEADLEEHREQMRALLVKE